MKVAVVIALIAFTACANAVVMCPLSNMNATTASGLTQCPQYNGQVACCTPATETAFYYLYTVLGSLGTNTSCFKNLQSIYCNGICSTNQSANVALTPNPVFQINQNTSSFAYDSCAPLCAATSPGNTIGNLTQNKAYPDPSRGPAFLIVVDGLLSTFGINVSFTYSANAGISVPLIPAAAADACKTVTNPTSKPTTAPTTKPANTTSATTGGSSTLAPTSTTATSSAATLYASAFLVVVALAL